MNRFKLHVYKDRIPIMELRCSKSIKDRTGQDNNEVHALLPFLHDSGSVPTNITAGTSD